MTCDLLIAGAELDGNLADVRIHDGRVVEIGARLHGLPGEDAIDARGGALIPGLHDHHVHLRALAAAAESVFAGPPAIRDRAALAERLRAAARGGSGWIRAVGYHQDVAGDLDAVALDAIVADRPMRVQHRGGALWILNSLAMAATQLDDCPLAGVERDATGRPTGRLWRMDRWLSSVTPPLRPSFERVSRDAAARGVTRFTDATPQCGIDAVADLAAAVADGQIGQRVWLMAADVPDAPRILTGPRKLVLDERALPGLDALIAEIAAEHSGGRHVAIHCLTRAELVLALAALEAAGSSERDRVEHAAIAPPEVLPLLRRTGITVVTQPNFVAERGDEYLAHVADDDLPHLYRLRSLAAAGVPVAAGTDAPFGGADPWRAIAAARERQSPAGAVIGPGERLGGRDALQLFVGEPDRPSRPRRIAVGADDLTLLRVPLAEAAADPAAVRVALTLAGGTVIYDARSPSSALGSSSAGTGSGSRNQELKS